MASNGPRGVNHVPLWRREAQPDFPQRVQSGINWVGLALRRFTGWPLGRYRETDRLSDPQCLNQPAARRLRSDYPALDPLLEGIAHTRALESLSYLEWLDAFVQAAPMAFAQAGEGEEPCRWLDAGAKNWAYLPALAAFLHRYHGESFRLDGVELDAHRRYASGQTRLQAACAHTAAIPQATYRVGDLRRWQSSAHLISHFLPFVFEDPHLAWGLPLGYFSPQALLNHLLARLTPGGLLLIVNQGEAEWTRQGDLLAQAAAGRAQPGKFSFQSVGQLPASFIEYRYPRWGWLCVRERA